MISFINKIGCLCILLLIIIDKSGHAQVADYKPPELQKIDVIEHLGDPIPLNLIFTNDRNESRPLSYYFSFGKPVIIVLAYYNCPMLCSLVLNGLTEAARTVSFVPGKDYYILTISIDPTETVELARTKKSTYVQSFDKSGAEEGWFFCVAEESQVKKLAGALGFVYYYDEKIKEYAHPAVLNFLTPDGTISRYLYGIQFKPGDIRLSLLEASQGRIGSTLDKIILYCYHYDPNAKGYVALASNIMKVGGLTTLVVLGIFLSILWTRSRLAKK